MDLNALGDEIAEVLDAIQGLRVWPHPPGSINPPAAIVSYPDTVTFDETYGRGMDKIERWPVTVVVGKATEKAARRQILEYASPTGDKSIKAVLEAHRWVNCDDLQAVSVEFDVVSIGGMDYIAATFPLSIAGPGN